MTVQEVVLDLLSYIGITGFAPDNSDTEDLDNSDTNRAVAAVNAGLQTVYKHGPKSLKEDERAAFFHDPTAIVVDTDVDNSMSITAAATPPDWINECSILVPGDSDLNRITGVTGNEISLLRGFRGPTQSGVQVTIYHDANQLADSIKKVTEPLMVTPNTPMRLCDTRMEFERLGVPMFGERDQIISRVTAKQVGQPRLALVERRPSGLYIYINPMPNQQLNVSYHCQLKPERISADVHLATDGGDDPQIEFTSVDESDVETILLPIARWHFFTHPSLLNAETRPAIKAAFDEAMMLLQNGQSLEPKVGRVPVKFAAEMPRF